MEGVCEDEMPKFLASAAPRVTPSQDPIEVNLSETPFGAQQKISVRKRTDRLLVDTPYGLAKTLAITYAKLRSYEKPLSGSKIQIASLFNNQITPSNAMLVRKPERR